MGSMVEILATGKRDTSQRVDWLLRNKNATIDTKLRSYMANADPFEYHDWPIDSHQSPSSWGIESRMNSSPNAQFSVTRK